MSDLQLPDGQLIICPNCKSLNHPNTLICAGCGIRLDTFQEVNQQWQSLQAQKNGDHLKQLESEAEADFEREKIAGRKQLIRGLRYVILSTLVLIPIVVGIAFLIGGHERARQEQMQTSYATGIRCMQQGDYFCARDAFLNIQKINPEYQDTNDRLFEVRANLAKKYLRSGQTTLALQEYEAALQLKPGNLEILQNIFDTRRLLSDQYAASNRWKDALNELDKALEIRPGDSQVLRQMERVYDQWYIQARASGNFLLSWWVLQQKNARFPNKPGPESEQEQNELSSAFRMKVRSVNCKFNCESSNRKDIQNRLLLSSPFYCVE